MTIWYGSRTSDLHGIMVTSSGRVLFSDWDSCRICNMSSDGSDIQLVAGTGNCSQVEPFYLAIAPSGTDLYVSDYSKDVIYKISVPNGIVTRAAGTGARGYSGDGGHALNARLNDPLGIAFDTQGNLFIADTYNNRVRRVDYQSGIITTVAGNGYQGDSGNGGPATDAQVAYPYGVAVSSSGEIFISTLTNKIRKVSTDGIISTIAVQGDALRSPTGINLMQNGDLYIAEYNGYRIRKISSDGISSIVAGNGIGGYSGDGGPATDAMIGLVYDVAVSENLDIFIPDYSNGVIRKAYIRTCYNILANNQSVCSGHGKCISPDQCQCAEGWMGQECQLTHRYEKTSNVASVC